MAKEKDEQLVVASGKAFYQAVSLQGKKAGVAITHLTWNEHGYIEPGSSIQELKIAVLASTRQTFRIETSDFLSAGRGDAAARARLEGRAGDTIRNMLSSKSA